MESLYIVAALGAVVAGFVQGLSGFAFGMVAMSFWAWTIEPQLAAAMAVFGALTGQIIAAVSIRRGFDFRLVFPFLLGGLVGIPMGVSILPALNPALFKAALGALLLIWCPIVIFTRHLPALKVKSKIADGVVSMIGGVMGDIGGFTGVIPTLWCTLRRLKKDSQRAIIQNFNLAALAATMLAYILTGSITVDMLPMFAIVGPAMLIPTLLGTKLYIGISEKAFRNIVLTLLTMSGGALLISSVGGVV
jgi:uncharacterized protein